MTKRRLPPLSEGLRDGLAALDLGTGRRLSELGAGIGEGLNAAAAYGAEFLPGGHLPIPQPCPLDGCTNGPYSSLVAFSNHLEIKHPKLSRRERTEARDTVRILCRKAIRSARVAL